MSSGIATIEGTWQHDVKRQALKDGPRFEGNLYYFISTEISRLSELAITGETTPQGPLNQAKRGATAPFVEPRRGSLFRAL